MITLRNSAAICGTDTIATVTYSDVNLATANDNSGSIFDVSALHRPSDNEQKMMRTALELFAEYGLGAAQEAYVHARKAASTHNRDGYIFWRGVCGKLDRKMVRKLAALPSTKRAG